MKLLAFTDLHCSSTGLKKLEEKFKENPDLIVCCGDFSVFGSGADKVAKKLNSFGVKVIIIPGNHELPNEILSLSKRYKNLIPIHKSSFDFQDYTFVGFGTGGFSLIEDELEELIPKWEKSLDKSKKLIFVTHAPVYKTKLDYLFGRHRGCKSSRKLIEKLNPVLTLCGHFHENEKKQDKIKNCLIINPGKFGMIIEI